MSVPLNPRFDRYAQLTGGLVQVSSELPFEVDPTGISIVTGFLTGAEGIWSDCYDAVTTVWAACYSTVSTVWSDCYTAIITMWTDI